MDQAERRSIKHRAVAEKLTDGAGVFPKNFLQKDVVQTECWALQHHGLGFQVYPTVGPTYKKKVIEK